jgi:glycosyltransferase involved in cell wall biosynthesis
MAIDAVGELKARGLHPLLIARGGVEAHGTEVAARARALGLTSTSLACDEQSAATLSGRLAAARERDIVFIESPLSQPQLQSLYRASHGVLANSGIEPFGLVGLEAMASGGVSLVGATGEDYATPGVDAIALQTSSPGELVSHVVYLREHPLVAQRIRREARRTAARFTWRQIIRTHITPTLLSRFRSPRASSAA